MFSQTAARTHVSRFQQRDALSIPHNAQVVLYASKLTRRKRPADLISAFARIAPRYPLLHLLIAGTGEEEAALQQQSREIGLGERVKFLGFVNQSALPSVYAASDLFVLPSQDEPWGLVVNEAMAAGLPVIVSNEVGAAPDLVQGRGTGIVYPVGHIAALADSLARLIADEPLRQRMGGRASALIRQWDIDRCVEGILKAVQETVSHQ